MFFFPAQSVVQTAMVTLLYWVFDDMASMALQSSNVAVGFVLMHSWMGLWEICLVMHMWSLRASHWQVDQLCMADCWAFSSILGSRYEVCHFLLHRQQRMTQHLCWSVKLLLDLCTYLIPSDIFWFLQHCTDGNRRTCRQHLHVESCSHVIIHYCTSITCWCCCTMSLSPILRDVTFISFVEECLEFMTNTSVLLLFKFRQLILHQFSDFFYAGIKAH